MTAILSFFIQDANLWKLITIRITPCAMQKNCDDAGANWAGTAHRARQRLLVE